jgi:5,10-methenyltetrahydromethanopterin hydrogenase
LASSVAKRTASITGTPAVWLGPVCDMITAIFTVSCANAGSADNSGAVSAASSKQTDRAGACPRFAFGAAMARASRQQIAIPHSPPASTMPFVM